MINKKIRKILFVCTGNSCRSVMAELLLKNMIKKSKELNIHDFKIYSAGTSCINNISPPNETLRVLSKEGIDASFHRSKNVTPEMLNEADIILVMQKHHKEFLKSMIEDKDKIYLLKEFCLKTSKDKQKGTDLNILDPIGKPLEVYEECLMNIKDCLEKIIKIL